ncbi:MAG: hypothetical protein ACFB5Z_03700 [Elainellaceae cyanobacterium]
MRHAIALAHTTRRQPMLALSAVLLVLGSVQASAYGHFHIPGTVPPFWVGIATMGMGYVLSWRLLDRKEMSIIWFWGVAVAARLVFLAAYPGDDIWRYLWEGAIQLQGFSPYEQAPSAPELLAYRMGWWSQINHPTVSSIYPPITQIGFRAIAAVAPSVLLFKVAFTAADVVVCWLLWQRFGTQALFYAWNPLVIYSFSGGGHYDSWFVLPLVMAWLFPFSKRNASQMSLPEEQQAGLGERDIESSHWFEAEARSIQGGFGRKSAPVIRALFIGISIGVKWISLPVLAFLSWRVLFRKDNATWRSRWLVALAVGAVGLLPLALSALVYCDSVSCPLIPTTSTFVSHGRSAELLPFIIGKFLPPSLESNRWFAPPLALVTLVLLLRGRSLGQFTLNYLIALMLLSPIIHAWYFTWMIPFAVEKRNWGAIWGSLSVFVYFVLLERQALGIEDWFLSPTERVVLWLPFVLGCLWTVYRQRTKASACA